MSWLLCVERKTKNLIFFFIKKITQEKLIKIKNSRKKGHQLGEPTTKTCYDNSTTIPNILVVKNKEQFLRESINS